MTTLTATAADEFVVTDAMFIEVQQATKSCAFATHAVIYPTSKVSDGWDFEVTSSARSAQRFAQQIGEGAEVMPL